VVKVIRFRKLWLPLDRCVSSWTLHMSLELRWLKLGCGRKQNYEESSSN
jgi:hypothetical protein